MRRKKLTNAENDRLAAYATTCGGQRALAAMWEIHESSLSQIVQRHRAPNRFLQLKLEEIGVIIKDKPKKAKAIAAAAA